MIMAQVEDVQARDLRKDVMTMIRFLWAREGNIDIAQADFLKASEAREKLGLVGVERDMGLATYESCVAPWRTRARHWGASANNRGGAFQSELLPRAHARFSLRRLVQVGAFGSDDVRTMNVASEVGQRERLTPEKSDDCRGRQGGSSSLVLFRLALGARR